MILHTVNKSPFSHKALADCAEVIGDKDGLLLLEDGVYALAPAAGELLHDLAERGIALFAIGVDVTSRGLSAPPQVVTTVDYDAFVALTIQYRAVQSWY